MAAEHDFSLRVAVTALYSGFKESPEAGVRTVRNTIKDLASLGKSEFVTPIEIRTNAATGEVDLFWEGYDRSIEESMQRYVTYLEEIGADEERIKQAEDDLKNWQEIKRAALALEDGQELHYLSVRDKERGEGIASQRLQKMGDKLVLSSNLLPRDNHEPKINVDVRILDRPIWWGFRPMTDMVAHVYTGSVHGNALVGEQVESRLEFKVRREAEEQMIERGTVAVMATTSMDSVVEEVFEAMSEEKRMVVEDVGEMLDEKVEYQGCKQSLALRGEDASGEQETEEDEWGVGEVVAMVVEPEVMVVMPEEAEVESQECKNVKTESVIEVPTAVSNVVVAEERNDVRAEVDDVKPAVVYEAGEEGGIEEVITEDVEVTGAEVEVGEDVVTEVNEVQLENVDESVGEGSEQEKEEKLVYAVEGKSKEGKIELEEEQGVEKYDEFRMAKEKVVWLGRQIANVIADGLMGKGWQTRRTSANLEWLVHGLALMQFDEVDKSQFDGVMSGNLGQFRMSPVRIWADRVRRATKMIKHKFMHTNLDFYSRIFTQL